MGNFEQRHTEKEKVKKQREDDHLYAKEKGLEQIFPSQKSETINPADTSILDF